jgi:3-hydroxyisobutyrate dehydrogenase-like beta-hydroxyacid dehydrogenase
MNEQPRHGGPTNGHLHVPMGVDDGRPAAMRVALLGTGKMGSAIAGRLVGAGFELTVWNRTRARSETLGLGRVAETPAEASRDADVVISSLTGADALRATYLGADGAIAGASGQLFIDMSTAGPDAEAELASAIQPTGARFVDAPILGSPAVVGAGQAAVLVGGEQADVERASPVLRAIGEVRPVGPLGSGARLKLVANSMFAAVHLAAAELQVAGEAAGLNPDDVFWATRRLAPGLDARRAGYLEDRHEPTLFALRDLAKDLNLAVELFGRSGVDVPMTRLARSMVSDAARHTGDLDVSSVIRVYRTPPTTAGSAHGQSTSHVNG